VVDFPEVDLNPILKKLSENYIARYNTDLKLITIRHFNKEALHKMKKDKKIYLEQNSRLTARLVVK
jgi:aspartate kinase